MAVRQLRSLLLLCEHDMTEVPLLRRQAAFPEAPFSTERGFRLGSAFIVATVVLLGLACVLFLSDAVVGAGVVASVWAVGIIFASPRAGVVIALTIQVFDIALNPEEGGSYQWLSPGRVIAVLVVLSYFLRILGGRSPSMVRTRGMMIVLGLFAAWCFVSLMWVEVFDRGLLSATKILLQVLTVLVAIDMLSELRVLRQALLFICVGAFLGGMYALFSGVAVRSASEARLAVRGTGINTLAVSAGIGAVAAIALMVQRRTPGVLLVAITSTIGITLLLLRTGTRSAILGVPMAVAIGAVLAYWRKAHKLVLITIVMATISGGTLYWALETGFIEGKLRDRVMGVFETSAYETNERWDLWEEALRIYLRNPIGTGAGNEALGYMELRGGYGSLESHNTFISVLLQYNVVGLGLFMTFCILLFRGLLHVKDPAVKAGAAMLLAYVLLNALKGSSVENRMLWQPILLAAAMIEADYRKYSTYAELEDER